MMTQPAVFTRRRLKIGLAIYLLGFLIGELLGLWGAYQNGGFDRSHTWNDLTIIASLYLVTGLLWPVVLIVVSLQLLGVLPHPIEF
jgi:hypothetical protein